MKVIKREMKKEDPYYVTKISQIKKLSHPNITNIIDAYMDEVNFYFICEIPKGKEIFETMRSFSTNFSEKTAGKIFYQLASLMFYMHSKNIIHGNIRPECLYLEYETYTNNLIHKSNACSKQCV